MEQVLPELLKACMSKGRVEVNTLIKGVDLNSRIGGGGKSALGTLPSGAETTQGTQVR